MKKLRQVELSKRLKKTQVKRNNFCNSRRKNLKGKNATHAPALDNKSAYGNTYDSSYAKHMGDGNGDDLKGKEESLKSKESRESKESNKAKKVVEYTEDFISIISVK